MANTALNRTTGALLTNKSGGNLTYGDVVVIDNTNTNGFTTTTTSGLDTRGLGVIIEPNGIANNASGFVATAGWCPQVNLNTAATVGQFIKTHTVAGQATPHSSPQVGGDFGVVLAATATPPAILFGSAHPSSAGTVTNTGTLTAGTLIQGNGGSDITLNATTATVTKLTAGVPSAASDGTDYYSPSTAPGYELDYVEFTAPVSPTATTEGTANTIVTSNSVSYNGTTIVMIEFFSMGARPDTGAAGRTLSFWLYEDAASIGRLGVIVTPAGGGSGDNKPVVIRRRMTPSNASHTYSIRASVSAGTGLVGAGAGGITADMPGYIRITRK